jgi:hypothetical protein
MDGLIKLIGTIGIKITKAELVTGLYHVLMICTIVLVIQSFKNLFKKSKVIIWKIAVVLLGFPAAILFYGTRGELGRVSIWILIATGIIYSALASFLYQNGKLVINFVLGKLKGKKS